MRKMGVTVLRLALQALPTVLDFVVTLIRLRRSSNSSARESKL